MWGHEVRFLLVRWTTGIFLGTLLVWASSPFFVSSMNCYRWDDATETYVLRPGMFRFRSEGFATTRMGLHGFAGVEIEDFSKKPNVIVWGDSQVQGLCVSDDEKIVNQAALKDPARSYLPLAKAGDSVIDWYSAMPAVDRSFSAEHHFILLTHLNDMFPDGRDFQPFPGYSLRERRQTKGVEPSRNGMKIMFADADLEFILAAAINVFFESKSTTLRKLRFSIGPVPVREPQTEQRLPPEALYESWKLLLNDMKSRVNGALTFIYSPEVPVVDAGRIVLADPENESFELFSQAAKACGVKVIDLRPALTAYYQKTGRFPRGFNNGKVGRGHLNHDGNDMIAQAIVDAVNNRVAP